MTGILLKGTCRSSVMIAALTSGSMLAQACMTSESQALCEGQTTIYTGGQVWNGRSFDQIDFAVCGGLFIDIKETGRNVQEIDVSGKFITPPYANAHHHITGGNDATSWAFMEHGVFYVWNPTLQATTYSQEEADYYARNDTYDVRVAMGAITEPGGHPEKLYVETLSQYVYPGKDFDYFYGGAFHYGRSEEEIDSALDVLEEQGAQFVKAMLLYSEEYEKRKDSDAYYGLKGLNPENMPYLVSAAHDRGLHVAVHIETTYDALVASKAGADMLAHLPGYVQIMDADFLEQIAFSAADAREIKDNGTIVVPTYALTTYQYVGKLEEEGFDTTLVDRHYGVQAENLRVLADAGVAILTGTDSYPYIHDEAKHWVKIGGLTIEDALQGVYQTGQYLFPDRKLGRIDAGYEADFLILGADPSMDIQNLAAIETRIKNGQVITAPEPHQ